MSLSVGFCWLYSETTLKEALKKSLGSSGQLIKRHLSSREQSRPVQAREEIFLPLTLVNHGLINPEYHGPHVHVILETKDVIVLHKPALIHCHPLSYEDQNTLLNFLVMNHKWAAVSINSSHYDRGLLYRLDYETSGVVVLAKSEDYLVSVREHFDSAVRRKFYWAIVEGSFDKEGKWTHFFKAVGVKGMRQKVFDQDEESAHQGTLTVFKVSEKDGKSLLLINLKTGLRHQIRAQLAHLGFPLLGDELYGGRKAERLFLHALRYEFSEIVEDRDADLFHLFFDLNRCLQMSHDMLRRF
jgi:23S rRNA pseudouridine1911/1915/1917 synthase